MPFPLAFAPRKDRMTNSLKMALLASSSMIIATPALAQQTAEPAAQTGVNQPAPSGSDTPATAVTAPAAFTKSRRETSWSWAIRAPLFRIFPDCSMWVWYKKCLRAAEMQRIVRVAALGLYL